MSDRFFWPLAGQQLPTVILIDGEQAHHAIHVMRYQVGDPITLFDGVGWEYQAEIESIQKKSLNVRIISSQQILPLVDRQITIAVAFPKGDRQRFLVEKLVELGVWQVIPLKTRRSVVEMKSNSVLRAEKWVIEACKQSRRAELMRIHSEINLDQLVKFDWGENQPAKLLAHPYGKSTVLLNQHLLTSTQSVLVAIGPEGGFDDQEIDLLNRGGFSRITLGRGILRTETAAISVAAWLNFA